MARAHLSAAAGSDAEDCVQESFIRLASQQPAPDDPAAWLMRVVRNAAIDAIRSQRRRRDREIHAGCERHTWLEPINSATLDLPSFDQIQAVLMTLDDVTRDVVVNHLWNDMTFRQIAEVLEMSPATSHRRYEAGIEAMRTQLAQTVRGA